MNHITEGLYYILFFKECNIYILHTYYTSYSVHTWNTWNIILHVFIPIQCPTRRSAKRRTLLATRGLLTLHRTILNHKRIVISLSTLKHLTDNTNNEKDYTKIVLYKGQKKLTQQPVSQLKLQITTFTPVCTLTIFLPFKQMRSYLYVYTIHSSILYDHTNNYLVLQTKLICKLFISSKLNISHLTHYLLNYKLYNLLTIIISKIVYSSIVFSFQQLKLHSGDDQYL